MQLPADGKWVEIYGGWHVRELTLAPSVEGKLTPIFKVADVPES